MLTAAVKIIFKNNLHKQQKSNFYFHSMNAVCSNQSSEKRQMKTKPYQPRLLHKVFDLGPLPILLLFIFYNYADYRQQRNHVEQISTK